MRFGIIAEGSTDQAVIANILKGLGIDSSDVIFIRPDLQSDETDKNSKFGFKGGTWQGVKNDCLARTEFENFYQIADNQFIIIQLDTAEAGEVDFGINKPTKENNPDYALQLRNAVIEKINSWLSGNYTDKLLYAISIEEMEAWILTIYSDRETTASADPKSKLTYELKDDFDRKSYRNDHEFYDKISKDFRKKKELLKFSKKNSSLKIFIETVQVILAQ
jgi:hypothetical protein